MDGARWAQTQLLASRPKADIQGFVIWFRMYPGDAESKWPRELLADPRLQHRWDEDKDAGKWFLEHLKDLRPAHDVEGKFPQKADAMWDTWMLFDRTARWTDKPGGLLSWGYPIIKSQELLTRDLDAVTK